MQIKSRVKFLLSKFHVHKKTRPDIFIFTLPRSGSTLLAEVLNTDDGSKMSSEPFALHNDNRNVLEKYFDKEFLAERYVDLKSDKLDGLRNYLKDLSDGDTWNSYYWTDLLSKQHSLKTNRTIFKTHKITYHFDDIMNALKDDYGIYLLRHPVSQALSRLRHGWANYIQEYQGASKIEPHLSMQAKKRIREIQEEGSNLEKMVLSWYLENFVFLRALSKEDLPDKVIPVWYENLVQQPDRTIRELCSKIEMDFSPRMPMVLKKPSSGIVHSGKETIDQINNKNHEFLINRWMTEQNEIDKDYLSDLQQVLGLSRLELH